MRSSGTGWGAELVIVYISGFLLATMLGLGLWFIWAPGRAAAFQEKEATWRAKVAALEKCVAAEDQQPNTVVVFNPKTKVFQHWAIPSGGGVVRNMVATPDGRLYLACSGVNKVAVVEVSR